MKDAAARLTGMGAVLLVATALVGCGKIEQKGSDDAGKARAEPLVEPGEQRGVGQVGRVPPLRAEPGGAGAQRPGGIVSGDMRANVALRIALRVRDRVDSEDVIEAPDAASVSVSWVVKVLL